MGYRENQERDRIAQARVQAMREEGYAAEKSAWLTSPTKRELDQIRVQAAARAAAKNGTCMTARTTVALLSLSVVVLRALATPTASVPEHQCGGARAGRQWDSPGDSCGGAHAGPSWTDGTDGPCIGFPREMPGCNG
jgi:hypothetical protein